MVNPHRLARFLGWFSIGLGLGEILAPAAIARLLGTRKVGVLQATGLREVGTGFAILSEKKTTSVGLWGRVLGDLIDLAFIARVRRSKRHNDTGIAVAGATLVAAMAVDVWCAYRLSFPRTIPTYRKRITVERPAIELHDLWSNPLMLSRVMAHIAKVDPKTVHLTHWTVELPTGQTLAWYAKYLGDDGFSHLGWHSLEGADVFSEGRVSFLAAPFNRGTEVTLEFSFVPTKGLFMVAPEKVFGVPVEVAALRALRRFKCLAETGEIPTHE